MLSKFLTQDEGHANIGNLHLLCHVCYVSGVLMVRQYFPSAWNRSFYSFVLGCVAFELK